MTAVIPSSVPVTSRALVVACVMASMTMVALEMTIVSTAMPQIAMQLGGLGLYSWVFSSFVLTQTAMTVVFGKLADVHGRKPVMLLGITVFIAGSLLAGMAWTMPLLIAARLVQGVGAGAILPVGLTIVADFYPARERGKVQGYLASVWAVSALVGPVLGGLIMREASWAWIFWINVPIGVATAIGFATLLRTDARHARPAIDYPGAALFVIAIASLMVFLTDTATASALRLGACAGLFGASVALFVIQERRAADPMVSFELWRRRSVVAANGAAVVSGMALMGLTTFLPMYVQGVLHLSPTVAGLTLTMVMVGWPAGATLAARLFVRFGLRPIMIVGGALLPLGATAFIALTPISSPVPAALGSAVMGLGMGLISVSSLILIQELVAHGERASATASNLFARNLGSTLGAAVLGAVQTAALASPGPVALGEPMQAFGRASIQGATRVTVDLLLSRSLHTTFRALFALTMLSILFVLLVPNARRPTVERGLLAE